MDIPLIKDLTETFEDFKIDEHFNNENIIIHNNLINNNFKEYTNEQIYNYSKFPQEITMSSAQLNSLILHV